MQSRSKLRSRCFLARIGKCLLYVLVNVISDAIIISIWACYGVVVRNSHDKLQGCKVSIIIVVMVATAPVIIVIVIIAAPVIIICTCCDDSL